MSEIIIIFNLRLAFTINLYFTAVQMYIHFKNSSKIKPQFAGNINKYIFWTYETGLENKSGPTPVLCYFFEIMLFWTWCSKMKDP